VGEFPTPTNPAQIRENNANSIGVHHRAYRMLKEPVAMDIPTMLIEGQRNVVGVSLNGIAFVSYGIHAQIELTGMDECGGAPDHCDEYSFANPAKGLTNPSSKCTFGQSTNFPAGAPSPKIGYALDGFPIFGPFGADGRVPDDLDICGGRLDSELGYVYHVQTTAPFTLGCFRGQLIQEVGSNGGCA